jgi:acyl-CoA synthetase (AMP-forming)/AMP-acid ligase II
MAGYYIDPEATAEAFRSGWFHSRDLGVMHPDGYTELRDHAKGIVHRASGGAAKRGFLGWCAVRSCRRTDTYLCPVRTGPLALRGRVLPDHPPVKQRFEEESHGYHR